MPEKPIYDWERFWCRPTGRLDLSDDGYLFDPRSANVAYRDLDVVPFDVMDPKPCLVLLGEPGSGKTVALQSVFSNVADGLPTSGTLALWFDLRDYASDISLDTYVFQSPKVKAWSSSNEVLHLFLDGLDESPLRIDTLAAVLLRFLSSSSRERLRLRLICRTASWPPSLEVRLRRLWGENSVGVYELAPLRRQDVAKAASTNGLDQEKFLREVGRAGVVPFAIKPVTLPFLLSEFRREGSLPSRQWDLYVLGCRLLCEETNELRREAGLLGALDPDQRLTVAGRIAALTVLGRRSAVSSQTSLCHTGAEYSGRDITVSELSGGIEWLVGKDTDIEVSEGAVRDVLSTGLFSSRGTGLFGWSHQSYAEFLAAWYLVGRGIRTPQALSLIVHPADSDGRIVPQLQELAAWLADAVPGVFEHVVSFDPESLLSSSVYISDDTAKGRLTETLLAACESGALLLGGWDLPSQLRKLAHGTLAGQLRPYVADSSKTSEARYNAIEIAEACGVVELLADLCKVALDESQSELIRRNAAHAVLMIGSADAKRLLRPLALGQAGDDPNDELKGYGLMATWPDHLSSEELFFTLTPPKRSSFLGSYYVFLSSVLPRHMGVISISPALKWVTDQTAGTQSLSAVRELEDAIMLRAWECIDTDEAADAFAAAALARLRRNEEIASGESAQRLIEIIKHDDATRHEVLKALLPLMADNQADPIHVAHSDVPLVISRDIPWLLGRLASAVSTHERNLLIRLVTTVLGASGPDEVSALYDAAQCDSELALAFSWLLRPVLLDSPEAQRMRADYQRRLEWKASAQDQPTIELHPNAIQFLQDSEAGDKDAWWHLNLALMLTPGSPVIYGEHRPNITAMPGWKAADESTQCQIIEAAKRHILNQSPPDSYWLAQGRLSRPAVAGYRAFHLLLQTDPQSLANLAPEVWARWARAVVAFPFIESDDERQVQKKLVMLAYQNARAEVIDTLSSLLDEENRSGSSETNVVSILDDCWDDTLGGFLADRAKQATLRPKYQASLLAHLLDRGSVQACDYAVSLVSSGHRRPRAVLAAIELLGHSADCAWKVLWSLIRDDRSFGQAIVSIIARRADDHIERIVQRVPDDGLADLYLWLSREYPNSEDVEHEGAYLVGPRDRIRNWKVRLLQQLRKRGTEAAYRAILRVVESLPDEANLKWILKEARHGALASTWEPLDPNTILSIAHDDRLRLIQNGDQLIDTLVESLIRLQERLHGETPAVLDLWNEYRLKGEVKLVYTPKIENRFSDYVKRFLDADIRARGIVVNREVEFRSNMGGAPGERTDIHVDAIMRGHDGLPMDAITAIIEAKGSWHDEIDQAMQTQLVDRYLREEHCRFGLYLVGWFNCEQWRDDDSRKADSFRRLPSLPDARERFKHQAAELSTEGRVVKAVVMDVALR